ncbi:MAG: AsnC family transcriptional regulator [Paracoccus sp. (in: a-proteobacteria)]|uniref:Lrp/AsnC family transcriptional regulator n=1 Tax=Paracoccus sp. TaxID=267 RepID=UPI0026E04DF1|nr:AsnC family transcriptional regulator [Paracoccus sp. (in: a-proteobacteria)]MDO5630330.1 AsnC family transcriptional regulator [Paracoccus sp. (in: a-proteobacteria)]
MTRPIRHTLPADALDDTDRRIINQLQDGFPISPTPFADVAVTLDIDETDLIERILRLRDIGAITRFGPFYDAAAMGGAFCLCAMEVPAEKFDEVATLVNAHPEVAHNYQRSHQLNMWFVLATETPAGIRNCARRIEKETGLRVLMFPKEHEFFIGFRVQA